MQHYTHQWPISRILSKMKKGVFNLSPEYQRGDEVWGIREKQALIESVLHEECIENLRMRRVGSGLDKRLDVVDGKQRMLAMQEYRAGGFHLARHCVPMEDGEVIAGKRYKALSDEAKEAFNGFTVSIVEHEMNAQQSVVKFVNAQRGKALNLTEKRNALLGNKIRDFVFELSKHRFWTQCQFRDTRFAYQAISCQCLYLTLCGDVTKNMFASSLDLMYRDHALTFDRNGRDARIVIQTLDFLAEACPSHEIALLRQTRTKTISVVKGRAECRVLFSVVRDMLAEYDIQHRAGHLTKALERFNALPPEQRLGAWLGEADTRKNWGLRYVKLRAFLVKQMKPTPSDRDNEDE